MAECGYLENLEISIMFAVCIGFLMLYERRREGWVYAS